MAKEIERTGIPVAYVTTLTSLAEEIRANRIVAGVRIPHPVGNPSLTPESGMGSGTPCRSNTTGSCTVTAFDSSLTPSVNSKPR